MGVLKGTKSEIHDFSFKELIPGSGERASGTEAFELKSLKSAQAFKNNISEDMLREERTAEAQSGFSILEHVREHRGIRDQEERDYEDRVAAEVQRRLESLKEEAYRQGLEQGQAEGKAQAYEEAKVQADHFLSGLAEQIEATQEHRDEILSQSKTESYRIVKNLTKWIILKDIDEKYYLSRLLEKLVHEINQKNNLVLHVNEDAFGYMPEVIKLVERKLGKLANVRIEVDLEMQGTGLRLEAENSIIDGSIEAQFSVLDDLFKKVGVDG